MHLQSTSPTPRASPTGSLDCQAGNVARRAAAGGRVDEPAMSSTPHTPTDTSPRHNNTSPFLLPPPSPLPLCPAPRHVGSAPRHVGSLLVRVVEEAGVPRLGVLSWSARAGLPHHAPHLGQQQHQVLSPTHPPPTPHHTTQVEKQQPWRGKRRLA